MLKYGYTGKVYPVNPNAQRSLGRSATRYCVRAGSGRAGCDRLARDHDPGTLEDAASAA